MPKSKKEAAPAQNEQEITEASAATEPNEVAEFSEADALSAQLAAEKESYLRLAAEYDNFRKRSAKEKDAILSEALALAVSAFLPLIDNVERAAAFAGSNAESVREGVLLMEKQMLEIAQKIKLEAIDPAGHPFDPTFHDAVMHVEDEAFGESTVAEVLQKGWRIGDKVIRHAMVKVAN